MAPTKQNSRRNRQRRNRRTRGIIETFTFSVIQGNSTTISVGTLTSRPPRSNFRPIWLEVEVCGYQPGGTSTSGWLAPVGCQIGFRQNDSDSSYASTSRLLLAGATPKKLRTYYPRSSDWFPYNESASTSLADINAVCVGPTGPTGTTGFLRGIGRLLIIVQEEQCATSCPAIGDVIPDVLPVVSIAGPSTSSSRNGSIVFCDACHVCMSDKDKVSSEKISE